MKEKKVVYVAVVGRPNAWKSTFLNALLDEKVSITSHVPQTTRKKVLGIFNDDDSQIIFLDTPGIHKSEKVLNQTINAEAFGSLKSANLVLYFVDGSREAGDEEAYISDALDLLPGTIPVVKVITKRDIKKRYNHSDYKHEISSITKEGFDALLDDIKSHLPAWPMLFPEDMYTKQDIFFRISEVIREKVFLETKEELPHSIFIAVEEIDDTPELLRISAYVYTDTDSQKYIVIGKSGKLISLIGKNARIELEKIFDKKVFLALRVKVRKGWKKDEGFIKKMFQ